MPSEEGGDKMTAGIGPVYMQELNPECWLDIIALSACPRSPDTQSLKSTVLLDSMVNFFEMISDHDSWKVCDWS